MHFQTSLLPTWNRLRRGRTVKFNHIYICRTPSIKLCRPPKGTVLDASLWLAATVCWFPRETQSQRMIACFWFQSAGMLCAHWWKIKGCRRQTEPCQKISSSVSLCCQTSMSNSAYCGTDRATCEYRRSLWERLHVDAGVELCLLPAQRINQAWALMLHRTLLSWQEQGHSTP